MTILKVNHINWTSKWEATSSSKDPMEYAQYLTEESSKSPNNNSISNWVHQAYRERDSGKWTGQTNTAHPTKTGTLTKKSISKFEGGKTQTLGQISTKLNQIAGEWSRHHKDWKGKLRPSYGVLWAPHKPTTTKSILQTREVCPSSSHWGRTETKVQTPNEKQG